MKKPFEDDYIRMLTACNDYYNDVQLEHALSVEYYAITDSRFSFLTEEEKFIVRAVAIGHDLLEDTEVTADYLYTLVSNPIIVETILLLTHNDYSPYEEYIRRVMSSDNVYAKLVKTADMRDHLSRKETLTPKLEAKYKTVLKYFL